MGDILEQAAPPHSLFDTILVLDFGSQTSHLILRRLRSFNVYAEMLPCNTKLADLPFKPVGIIFSGGPASVYDEGSPHVDPAVFDLGVPILGICYGCQEIAWISNPENVKRGDVREYGLGTLNIQKVGGANHIDLLLSDLGGDTTEVINSHFDKLVKLPEGFVTIGTTRNSPYAAIAHQTKKIFGLQFHPEISHSVRGTDILKNYAVKICGARPDWKMAEFKETEIARIRKLVGDRAQVIGAVSGGVDSTVAARLMTEAIGDRFHAILVDNGVMRLNECTEVKATLKEHLGINLTVVDGADLFLGRLKGVTEPERKRKVCFNVFVIMLRPLTNLRRSLEAKTFIDLFEKEAIRIEEEAKHTENAGPVKWFLQGTLYTDVIESLSFRGPSHTIKSHHNVGGLPKRMTEGQGLQLLEPLREMFKDEVRAIGQSLGIHRDLVMRHPFPGPGLAIRVLGEVTPERVEICRKADHIFISMIKEAGVYDSMSQAYAAVDSTKSVGVQGDARVYGYIVILRAVCSDDFMSAEPYEFDWKLLREISRRIVNEVDGVSRVTYDTTSKPPGTIEME
ncbi:GMP synthase [glutamine-hydrolyzing] [Colletotrichum gloeosporioides]|uniref:GMP synthase [glutamine-hydrolyzing] n=1 Tax=Colletotrichum gloeosporioides TaxID=474922 RepID=A0A8H4CJI4_COLGL|nr:GMP synthase [glutamine-hydrolyzing] [Colletotrichum gloeosporioides]KAF3805133.1 GMP synthase [glutamine-hydrolyzing] [Colletotrichum gloeosporioides]